MPDGERRLAAIMYTDMVGFTALAQKNEELSLALLSEQRKLVRPILTRHRGREVKTMGDAFLVEFQSGLEGAKCAYDIQKAIREYNGSVRDDKKVHLRVGIHLGDVVESQGDISGDAVNVASRVEPLAEDGGVCLTRQVYDQVSNKLDVPLESLGPKRLKNVSAPVEVFKMVMPWDEPMAQGNGALDQRRVAILPFANMSPEAADAYFADGMTEELIASLSGVGGLTVIARTSVMKYKGTTKGVSEIARELGTGSLVEGSVRKAANRVRITVQLIDARNEGHLWAQNYDRDLNDIFAIQSDVAGRVADALKVKLLSSERERLRRAATSNIEAYTLYLKGNYHNNTSFGRVDGMKRAIAHYEEAVANDPSFAIAYSALSYTYTQIGFFGMADSKEMGKKAKEYAEKALALDPSLPEAHHALGRYLRNYEWDLDGARREFERAVELNPSYSEAYGALATLLSFNRDFSESVVLGKKTLDLDPVSSVGNSYLATLYLYAGMNVESIEEFDLVIARNPQSAYAKGNRGLAMIRNGQLEAGLAEVVNAASLENPASQADLAYAYAACGKKTELGSLLKKLLSDADHNAELSVAVASAYANSGDADHAVEWLEKARVNHVSYLVSINADFVFDAIRSDPRFHEVMRKIGYTNVA